MSDTMSSPVRIARVTTRRMHTQTIQCPLDPEMLVAEFAGELPPDIARLVREHLLFCETCSARSRTLRSPYQLISALGTEPVPYVADLRDSVRTRVRSRRAIHEVMRFTARLGRGGTIALTGLLGLAVICVFLAVAFLFPAIAGVTTRSQNALAHVPAAAAGGVLYAETSKLVSVTDSSGTSWQITEVIAVDQHSGKVLHSLPVSGSTLRVAQANQLPLAVQVVDNTVLELTPRDGNGRQALVAFNATTGNIRYITRLTMPADTQTTGAFTAASLVVSPDHSLAYLGLTVGKPGYGDATVLVVDMASGKITRALAPDVLPVSPMPPPPTALPISAFPSGIPYLNVANKTAASGLHGALAISPDGKSLFDVLSLTGSDQKHYALVRRFDAVTGAIIQTLAMPGDFSLAQLLSGNSATTPQLYLVTGSPDAHCYVLDASAKGPLLVGDVPLGGPLAPPNTGFSGSLQVTQTADGGEVYITQDVTSDDKSITGHDVWIVDTHGMAIVVHHSASATAGMVLPNSSTAKGARAFALRDGVVSVTDPLLNGALIPWLQLSDGKPVIQLLTTTGK